MDVIRRLRDKSPHLSPFRGQIHAPKIRTRNPGGALGEAEGCHCTWGPAGEGGRAAWTAGGGAWLHLSL